jgi:hypothetical protein
MVSVKINGTKCDICTKWEEVDIDNLIACDVFKDELKALTTIPHDIIDRASSEQLWPFYTLFSFIDDTDNMPEISATDIEDRWYIKFEMAKAGMKVGKPYAKIIRAARAYYPKEEDPVRLIGLGVSIVNQISVFLSKFEDMIHDKPTDAEIRAGVEDLAAFGFVGTVFNLAGRDILKMKNIYHLPLLEVYTILHYTWREAKYQKELFSIRNPKLPKA